MFYGNQLGLVVLKLGLAKNGLAQGVTAHSNYSC